MRPPIILRICFRRSLWTLFCPGTLVHTKIRGFDRAFKISSYWMIDSGAEAEFYMVGGYTDYNGANFDERGDG